MLLGFLCSWSKNYVHQIETNGGNFFYKFLHLVIVLNILLFQTWNGGDYFQAFVGTGYGGFYWLYSHTTHTVPWVWYTDTEFLSLFWHSDGHYDLKPGFTANVYTAGK